MGDFSRENEDLSSQLGPWIVTQGESGYIWVLSDSV
jgi:hypothetical protein